MNKRQLKLENYGISNNRYAELRNFCRQYPEWIDELKYKTDAVKSPNIDGLPKAGYVASSTESLVIRRGKLQQKCELIDQVAIEASGDLYQYIIKSVCYGKSVHYVKQIMGMPCDERTFYDYRRYFFYLLDKKR